VKKRVVAIFTGNRAEYGLQYPILRAIEEHPDLDYRLIVSGAHLDRNFGGTLDEIHSDGFRVDAEAKIEMDADSLLSTAQAIGSGICSISNALSIILPDLVVVYADRFEGFAAVIAATQMNIATAHVEGGDLTEGGALDDSVRHAMTKLSHLHFTTNQQATNRLLAMGEEPWRVHTVGFPAIDLIAAGNFESVDRVVARLGLDLKRPIILFTQHAVTTEYHLAASQVKSSLVALEEIAEKDGAQIILTYPNNDAGGLQIIRCLEEFHRSTKGNIQLHRSLGRHLFQGVLGLAKDPTVRLVVVGNSSSGLKETPAFGCPTVNIGSRQEGRLRGDNVIDVGYTSAEIAFAIRRCLFDEELRSICRNAANPYYLGDAGRKIAKVLAEIPLNRDLIRKKMTLKGLVKDGWFQ
jgi:UDP-hydrolysing UDP-N-acetyl-D-glucosamine 2-epimerase